MNYELRSKHFYFFLFIIFLISIDQISKYIIRHGGGFYVCNPNIAFGIEIPETIFWVFWIGIIGAIFWELGRELCRHSMSKWTSNVQSASNVQSLALTLILAGALSNMVDRMALGCVVDFIDLRTCLPVGMVWPVFNLADSFIVLGAVILLAKWRKM